jgi:hypothetical protein
VGAGVDIGLTVGGLRDGSDAASDTADAAGAVVRRLAGVRVDQAAFGQVDQSGPLAAALEALVGDARDVGQRVSDRHADLAQQARAAAGLGTEMVDGTTAAAGGGAPASRAAR